MPRTWPIRKGDRMDVEFTGEAELTSERPATDENKSEVAAQATSEAMMSVDTFLYHCWKPLKQERLVA